MLRNLLTQIEPVYQYCMGGVVLFFAIIIAYSFYMSRRQNRRSF